MWRLQVQRTDISEQKENSPIVGCSFFHSTLFLWVTITWVSSLCDDSLIGAFCRVSSMSFISITKVKYFILITTKEGKTIRNTFLSKLVIKVLC